MLDHQKYRAELERLAEQFRIRGAAARLVGESVGSFLVVDLNQRGAEVYRGGDKYIFDPAESGELLGEAEFPSLEEVTEAAWQWLEKGVFPSGLKRGGSLE